MTRISQRPGYSSETIDVPASVPSQMPIAFGDPGNRVFCTGADQSSINDFTMPDGTPFGTIALAIGGSGFPVGIFCPLSADQARDWSVKLAHLADFIDQGKGKQ